MELIGFWKLSEVMRFDENSGKSWAKVEDLMADESIEPDEKKLFTTVVELTPDGQLLMMLPVPEDTPKEEIDEAVAEGEVELHENGMLIYEKHPYKEEDGKLLYDTRMQAEVFGEKLSSWDELKQDGDTLEMMFYRFVRM